ncbi:hypothetical protein, partial [Methylobacterium phyllosphaerae]
MRDDKILISGKSRAISKNDILFISSNKNEIIDYLKSNNSLKEDDYRDEVADRETLAVPHHAR